MTNGQYKAEYQKVKAVLMSAGYDEFDVQMAECNNKGPLANHPEILRLAELFKTVVFTGKIVGTGEMEDGV